MHALWLLGTGQSMQFDLLEAYLLLDHFEKALKVIERNLADNPLPVHFHAHGDSGILVRVGQAVVYARLLEGRFPRYEDALPANRVGRIALEADGFLSVVEQAAIATSEESRGVEFTFAPGKLTINSQPVSAVVSNIEHFINYDGPTIPITLDARYVLDAVKPLGGIGSVTLDLVDEKTAAVLTTEDGYTHVIMPLGRN